MRCHLGGCDPASNPFFVSWLRAEGFGGRIGEAGKLRFVGEGERFGVDAISQAGGCGTVLKDVAEVGVAATAEDLGSDRPVAAVFVRADVSIGHRLEEAGPTRARVELRVE